MTPYQAAETLQGMFSFTDDMEASKYHREKRLQGLLGDDCRVPGFRDYADIDRDPNRFYHAVRALVVRKYGDLPF